MPRRRSSSSITLVLIGATAMTSCGQSSGPDTLRRDLYASKADCMQDWGADAAKCEPARTTSSTRTGSSYSHFYGPAYTHGSYGSSRSTLPDGSTSEARPGSKAIGTAHVSKSSLSSSSRSSSSSGVSRSGFGSSSSSHSSSSSRGSSAS